MGSTVKITKAKQLRYKLISVMYLLFIALSIINIPIEWLHVNKYLAPLLTETTIVSIDNPELEAVYKSVEHTKKEFYTALGYDEVSKTYREPFGYSVTDAFFINNGKGTSLQEAIKEVHAHADRLGMDQRQLFNTLFEEDLKNGLLNDGTEWVKWKFKHVPASMAEVLLNEIILRVRLISGDLEFRGDSGNGSNQSIVEYATNLDYLVFGDTIKLRPSMTEIDARVTFGSDTVIMERSGKELIFVPTTTGNHILTLRGKSVEESYSFVVMPAQISGRQNKAFITYFKGSKSSLELGTVIAGGTVNCSCDPQARYDQATLKFTPTSAGWCQVTLRAANGVSLLNDSVFIQEAPQPYFKIKGLLDGDRLPRGSKTVELEAFHPTVDAAYKISEVTYEKLGTQEGDFMAQSASIDFSDYSGAVWIKKVVATSGGQTFETNQPFLITIEP